MTDSDRARKLLQRSVRLCHATSMPPLARLHPGPGCDWTSLTHVSGSHASFHHSVGWRGVGLATPGRPLEAEASCL